MAEVIFGGGVGGGGESIPPQDSILTEIGGYYFNIGGSNVLVRNYCPKYIDCASQSSSFLNANGTATLKGTPKYSTDY